MLAHTSPAPLRPARLMKPGVRVEIRADGVSLLHCTEALEPHPLFITDRLEHYAEHAPERIFLTQATAGADRQRMTYAECRDAVRAIAQALLQRGLGADTIVAVLSDNSIEQALLTLACQYVGVPVAPVSPPYALMSQDFGRLREVFAAIRPALVCVGDARFGPAIAATLPPEVEVVVVKGTVPDQACTAFSTLLEMPAGDAVQRAAAERDPDRLAKLLFTSGSTGNPKGVINTHRMLASNQQMIRQTFAFLQDEPPVMVDWLPWNHTFGGNHNFGIALYNGGTFHIDEGRPTPGGIAATLANLRAFPPTIYFNVPRGFEALLQAFAGDDDLAEKFFSRLRLMFYAAAALPQATWSGLIDAAVRSGGERILMLTGLGSTETGPFALSGMEDADRPGEIGVPAPGNVVKLVPTGPKLELRLRSPSLMPGYWQAPELSASVFDDEGFYCIGDAVRFIDPDNPARGLTFDGRISEDFKLSTGVWVNVARLRARVLACLDDIAQDAVIFGHDRDEIGALLVLDAAGCRARFGNDQFADSNDLAMWLRDRLTELRKGGGSSDRIGRLAILRRPLRLDSGELTDKGTVSSKRVLETRAGLIASAYGGDDIVWEPA